MNANIVESFYSLMSLMRGMYFKTYFNLTFGILKERISKKNKTFTPIEVRWMPNHKMSDDFKFLTHQAH